MMVGWLVQAAADETGSNGSRITRDPWAVNKAKESQIKFKVLQMTTASLAKFSYMYLRFHC